MSYHQHKLNVFKLKSLPLFIKVTFLIYATCFLIGGLSHWIDILDGGVFPYKNIPFIFNSYLASLAIFDFIVVLLLFIRPISALLLAICIMVSDLIVDFYVGYHYWGINIQTNLRLQLLVTFGLFVFISAPLLIKYLKK